MAKIKSLSQPSGGLAPDMAGHVFDDVAQFASYGFNKSHAAAYASLTFQTAYLKTHYAVCYHAALLNMTIGKIEDVSACLGEMKRVDIPVLAPNINLCNARFIPMIGQSRMGVAYGLAALRGVGMESALAIEHERSKNGPYASLKDFRDRTEASVNRKALLSLIHAGAFDFISPSRADCAALVEGKGSKESNMQVSMFDIEPSFDTRETLVEYDRETLLMLEFDAVGSWLTGHPLESFKPRYGDKPLTLKSDLVKNINDLPKSAWIAATVQSFSTRATKSGGLMAVVILSDQKSTFEAVCFDEDWAAIRYLCKPKTTLALNVFPRAVGDDVNIMIKSAAPLDLAKKRKAA